MKPHELSFAESFGLSNISMSAIRKRDLKNVDLSNVSQKTVPLTAGADAFAFRNHGIAELFQGKQVRT